MKKFEVAGYDMPCVDLAVNVDVFPKPNGGTGINALSWQGGGKVASGMVASARLGGKCAMLGGVGDDDYGKFCLRDFERHGIDVSGMSTREGETTSLSIVLSDRETNGRSIVYRRGTAQALTVAELDREILEDCQWFFMSRASEVCLEAARLAKAAGAKVIVDADSYSSELMEHIDIIDAFVASEFFYNVMFHDKNYEENCKKVFAMGPSIVVFTLGAQGCVGYSEESGFFNLPSFDVKVQDTVGAGDVFHGAYVMGLVKGFNAKEAARLATGVSCIKCTRIGGRAGIPDWNTLQHFLDTGEIDYTEIDRRVEFYGKKLQLSETDGFETLFHK